MLVCCVRRRRKGIHRRHSRDLITVPGYDLLIEEENPEYLESVL
jgi:hypothetical protein